MAEKNTKPKSAENTSSQNHKGSGKKGTSAKKSSGAKGKQKQEEKENTLLLTVWSVVLVIVGLAFLVCLLIPQFMGSFGGHLYAFLHGMCGGAAILASLLFFAGAFLLRRDAKKHVIPLKILTGIVCVAAMGVFFHFAHRNDPVYDGLNFGDVFIALYEEGADGRGGGILGGLLGKLLGYTGTVGTFLISIPVFILTLLAFFGMTPKSFVVKVQYLYYKILERRDAIRSDAKPQRDAERAAEEQRREEVEAMRQAHLAQKEEYAREREEQRRREELRQAEAERSAQMRQTAPKKRRGYIDPEVFESTDPYPADTAEAVTDDERKTEPIALPAHTEEPAREAPVSSTMKRRGKPVSEEAYDRGPFGVTDDMGTPAVPDGNAYALAEQDERDAAAAKEEIEVLHAENTARPIVPTAEIDLKKIFADPEKTDKTEETPDGTVSDLVEEAETELTVRRIQPEEAPEETEEKEETSDPLCEPSAEELLASLNAVYRGEQKKEVPPEPVYLYPPVTLLKKDTSDTSVDLTDELRENGEKLEAILRSFNVKTKIVNISRGPTITRYELQPEAGTRVRSVANLVDDIALGLAASGVRIEAPIPGKSAIGVEVPNRTVSTVYIRSLIESDTFGTSKSRLTTCLGMDVAGAPIYLDIQKMPHLLICGATGMGKSVCINSLIVSMLYKATPDEVKMILIDPKKVELNIYSGIPHLLVPVVSDPKKAAGALHWAVTEMERRFELIEDVGMRDIKGYNEITKNDPEKEHMSHIVIIIDELADLMMTAPDDVEQSICRIAQKARAAGMHLIIGTQRPSVDVITGLIKANVPSRIAFRVSSQMDSRVILDIVGAEKLIGRGDMLYAPVGAPKPTRVQGAFVSEEEIDAITTFLKKNAGQAAYSDDVMQSIEKEAALCGQKKGTHTDDLPDADADGEGDDPMLRSAIELAVESGKISTSLIQRRLSLGYGRAAKLIDRMEELGYVSAPEGQKPRQVLITKEQYMEMALRQGDGQN